MSKSVVALIFREGELIDVVSNLELDIIWLDEKGVQGHTCANPEDQEVLTNFLADAFASGQTASLDPNDPYYADSGIRLLDYGDDGDFTQH